MVSKSKLSRLDGSLGSKTEVNGKYKSYTYPDGHTGKFITIEDF